MSGKSAPAYLFSNHGPAEDAGPFERAGEIISRTSPPEKWRCISGHDTDKHSAVFYHT